MNLVHHPMWGPKLSGDMDLENPLSSSCHYMSLVDIYSPDPEGPALFEAQETGLRTVEECILRHGGRVLKRVGHTILASFTTGFQTLMGMMEVSLSLPIFMHPIYCDLSLFSVFQMDGISICSRTTEPLVSGLPTVSDRMFRFLARLPSRLPLLKLRAAISSLGTP